MANNSCFLLGVYALTIAVAQAYGYYGSGVCYSDSQCLDSGYHCCTGTSYCCPWGYVCTGSRTCISIGTIVGPIVGVVVLVISCVIGCICCRRRRNQQPPPSVSYGHQNATVAYGQQNATVGYGQQSYGQPPAYGQTAYSYGQPQNYGFSASDGQSNVSGAPVDYSQAMMTNTQKS